MVQKGRDGDVSALGMRAAAVRSTHFPNVSERVVTDANGTSKGTGTPFPRTENTLLPRAQRRDLEGLIIGLV